MDLRLAINKILMDNCFPEIKKASENNEAFTLPNEFVNARQQLLDLIENELKGEENG